MIRKYIVTVELNDENVPEDYEGTAEGYISEEMGWVAQSGIYTTDVQVATEEH